MSTDQTSVPPRDSANGSGGNALPPLSTVRRSRSDRKVAGVAGGLGRYLGIDPLILRILFVVLTIFGGSGIILYVAGWLLVAEDGEDESQGQRLLRGHTDGSTVATVALGVIVLVLGLVVTGAVVDTGPGLGGLGALVVVGLIVLLLRRNGQRPAGTGAPGVPYGPVPPPEPGVFGQTPGTAYTAGPAATTSAAASAPTAPMAPIAPTASSASTPAAAGAPGTGDTAATVPVPPVTPPAPPVPPGPPVPPLPPRQGGWTPPPPAPPKPPRERSVLGRLTFCAALVAVGGMLLWNATQSGSADDFRAVAVLGTALAIVGVGLVVGSVRGRARGLVVLGVLLSLATSAAAATDRRISGGVGERDWTPRSEAAAERLHRLGIGDAVLDLTGLPAGSDVDTEVRVGVGSLRVYVPADAQVTVDAEVGAGNAAVLDEREQDGTDVDVTASAGPKGGPSGTRITIDAEVGLGQVKVEQR